MTLDRTPLIVIAVMPDDIQAQLDGLRRAHYPAERNRVPAHCTLLHAVPGMVADELAQTCATLAATTRSPSARIERVIDLDGGTALAVDSPDLLVLREAIAERFCGMLTGADTLPARLHVTVQNKVERRTAHVLQAELRRAWHPRAITVAGLAAHRVRDGVWHPAGAWRFRR